MGRHAKTQRVLDAAVAVLTAHHPMTVRQCFYQLVSGHALENLLSSYKLVSRLLVEARQDGTIPWAWVEDRTRRPRQVVMWADLADFAETAIHAYRRDVWVTQPGYLEAWPEKDALSGTEDGLRREGGRVMAANRNMARSASVLDDAPPQIRDRVSCQRNGCWRWDGPTKHGDNKPIARIDGRPTYVARVLYAMERGPIDGGLFLPSCGNERCVRPDHQRVDRQGANRPLGPQVDADGRISRRWIHDDEASGCWRWMGGMDGTNRIPSLSTRLVARVGYRSVRAALLAEAGRPVRHRSWIRPACGDFDCVNPDHMELARGEWIVQELIHAGAVSRDEQSRPGEVLTTIHALKEAE